MANIGSPEIDFIHPKLSASDAELFGLDNPRPMPETFKEWSDVAVHLGIFNSKTEAKKNGWGDKLVPGFQQKFLKKKRILITILNWFE